MYLLLISLFLPIITNALVIVKIHRNSIYESNSSCSFIGNTTLSNGATIASCIWECVHTYDCQTAIYFENEKKCSMFIELCTEGSIQPSGNVWTSVICYRKNHKPIATCPLIAVTTARQDIEETSSLVTTTAEQDIQKTSPLVTTTVEQGVQKTSSFATTTAEQAMQEISPLIITTTTEQTTTTTFCTIRQTTTFGTPSVTSASDPSSFWSFDNSTSDILFNFDGTPINSPSYQIPGINGYGAALSLNGTESQFVNISSYRNLGYRSFTVEMWFYCTYLTNNDAGLFGQHDKQTNDTSLHYTVRNYRLHMGLYYDDLAGLSIININTWYHVAFVFDNASLTQKIYLNGKIDGNRTSSTYQGTSGSIVIGKTEQVVGAPNYFSGYIDQVSLVMRAKTNKEILDDATLASWHSFDGCSSHDSGSLDLNGTAMDVTYVNGRVNQAIQFISNSSYYQIGEFVLLGVSNYPYSIALWINPSIINASTVVHVSGEINGTGWCVKFITFSSNGEIVITGWNSTTLKVFGPIIPVNVWTHVAYTYSITNGLRLYINGTFMNATGPVTYAASNKVNTITLGNPLQGASCAPILMSTNVYSGYIDEFRVYSRELDTNDIYELANP